MNSPLAKLYKDINFCLMMLEVNPDLSQREMVKARGINYCLNAKKPRAWSRSKNSTKTQNKNKFGYDYLLRPSWIAEKTAMTSNF
jgi:hypothetical protein